MSMDGFIIHLQCCGMPIHISTITAYTGLSPQAEAYATPPPGFCVSVHFARDKVVCFVSDLEVVILRGLEVARGYMMWVVGGGAETGGSGAGNLGSGFGAEVGGSAEMAGRGWTA